VRYSVCNMCALTLLVELQLSFSGQKWQVC